MPKTSVLVRLAKADRERIDTVAADLEKRGLEISQKLATTGIIAGKVESSKMEELRDVQGVAQVRQEGRFQLPPTDEDIPQ